MNGLGVLNKIFLVLGSHDREYWLGLGGKPHKIPLDILQTLLMSCHTPYMVLSWALGSLGLMTMSIGNGHLILLYISTCTKL
jgi:hypothetical protein